MEQQIVNFINQVSITDLENLGKTLLAFAAGGVSVAVILQAIKHKWKIVSDDVYKFVKIRLSGSTVNQLLMYALTFLGAAADYVLNNSQTINHIWPGLIVAAITMHRFMVSPAYTKFIVPYLNYLGSNKTVSSVLEAPAATVPAAAPAEFDMNL